MDNGAVKTVDSGVWLKECDDVVLLYEMFCRVPEIFSRDSGFVPTSSLGPL